MTEKERMLAGELYSAFDEDLRNDYIRAKKLLLEYNVTAEDDRPARNKIIKELFGGTGDRFSIKPPFSCDYGYNIFIGNKFFCNNNCIILDVCKVTIGNNVLIGPRVSLYTAGHPVDPEIRSCGFSIGKPITIGDNVWIGGDTVINPGVTVGNNTVIGSGSVVTKDIPENVIAAGNPCRVIRPITKEDKEYWENLRDQYYKTME